MPSRSPTLQGKSMKMKIIVGIPLVVFCLFIPLSGNIGEKPIEVDMQKECQKYAFHESQGNSGLYERTFYLCMEVMKNG